MPTETTLLSFNPLIGMDPEGGLVADARGDLFGTTSSGGANGFGTIFELIDQGGGYAFATLASFNGADGSGPNSTLSFDADGNLIGTTSSGGTGGASTFDSGTVFELPATNGTFGTTPITLANFTGPNGAKPSPFFVFDATGDLFGIATHGGLGYNTDLGAGTLFEIPQVSGVYATAPTTLLQFPDVPGQVTGFGGLTIDAAGNLFGTDATSLVEVPNSASGYATATMTASSVPGSASSLISDASGDLFGISDDNTIFEVGKTAGGYAPTATTLATVGTVSGVNAVGIGGGSSLLMDAAGNLFGVTAEYEYLRAQVYLYTGVVFELPKTASGYSTTPVILDRFGAAEGGSLGTLVADAAGDLFDTTTGSDFAFPRQYGSIFELSNTGFATTAATDTIVGADAVTRSLPFGLDALAKLARPLLAGVAPAATLFQDGAGAATVAAGQTAAVDSASGAVSLTGNGASNETVVAGGGNFAFADGGGSGTIVAGAGNDSVALTGGGNWSVALGNGVDTVAAAAGNDTLITGYAGSLAVLGTGENLLVSLGTDTVLAGSGSATIAADGASDLVFANAAPLTFIAGSGASTLLGGAASTVFGGTSGGLLLFNGGATTYTGYGAADTIVGLSGSITVHGGIGGGAFFGGTAGHNAIAASAGNTTAIAGGDGDVLAATGTGTNLFAGSTGSETLTGAGSSAANTFFAGSGPETLVGGEGNTALVAGAGADLLAGGDGLTLFLFVAGRPAGGADTITGWDPSHDFVKLLGYGGSEAAILQAATVANGSSTITLSDNTQVTFAGVTQLGSSSFN